MAVLNDILEVETVRIEPFRNDEVEGLGSGQILTAELATPLWKVVITSPVSLFEDGRRIRALINSLTGPGQTFFVYDPISQYPINDPDGSILGASAVVVDDVAADGKIALSGFPPHYVLSPGDFFHMDVGGRRLFFETSEDVTAGDTGATLYFRTFPVVPEGIPANTPVTFIKPELKAQFIPSSLTYGRAESGTWKMTGFTVEAMQKL